MKLEKLLSQRESDILKRWLESILDTYPADTKRFLKKQHNRFANPVGHTISKETENLYRELCNKGDIDPERISPILDRIIRVRAIQDFTPSQAILFIFTLKRVIREELKGEIGDKEFSEDLLRFEEKIDKTALIAFDLYMKRREKIYEIMAKQAKNQVSSLLRKTGLVCEIPEWDPDKHGKTAV